MGGQLAGSIRVIRPLWKLIVAALAALVLYFVIANGITAPYSGSTREYSADFTDATGLRPNADVRIRGVKVGKVTGVELQQTDDNSAVAKVEFTVNQDHSLTTESKAAVRYANLSGVRYLDVTGADGRGERVRHLPTANTVSSFDVTELFNGLQPVLQTLSPEEINDFSNNALTVLQGDGSGLAPLLKSVDELSRYTANREKTISTLVGNMARISDSLGGTSPQILQFLKEIEVPIDSVLTVLDEFRKADKYGPPLMTVLNQLMAAIGLQTTTDLDQELARAFPDINNMWKSMDLFPSVVESMQLPAIASEKTNKCSKRRTALARARPDSGERQWGGRMSRMRRFQERLTNNDLLAGALVVAVIAIVVAGVSYFYLAPPGRQSVTFTTRDAAAVTGGEDVRVAGISVGKVSSVELRDKDVKVTVELDDTVRVGNRTRVKVQLLTAVGGYFVALQPSGPVSQDSRTITPDRVTVPYTVADILQELPRVTDNVTGAPVDQSMVQVADGVGRNTAAFRNAMDGLQTVATIMDRQKGQVESILSMAGQYTGTFAKSRDFVMELVRKVNVALSQYYTYRYGFSEAFRQLGGVLERLGVLTQFYLNHEYEFDNGVVGLRDLAKRLETSTQSVIDRLEPMRDQLMRLVGDGKHKSSDQFVIDASAMCLPVPGRTC